METNNKLRESMVQVKEIARTIYSTSETGSHHECLAEKIVEIANAALAEPVKNCEVGTAKEQVKRWRCFCDSMTTCGECPCHKSYSEVVTDCFSRWAQMPYVEKEGGNK